MAIKNFNEFDKVNEGNTPEYYEDSIVEMVGDWIENERSKGASESEVKGEIDAFIGALEPNEQKGIRVEEIVKRLKDERDWTVLEER